MSSLLNLGLQELLGGVQEVTIAESIKANNAADLMHLYNGSKEAKTKLADGVKIEGTMIARKAQTFIMVSYASGSLVGVTTKGANLLSVLYTNPGQFFEDGILVATKIRKVLSRIGTTNNAAGSGVRYTPVFVAGINKDFVVDRFRRGTVLCRVSVHEMEQFKNRIAALDINALTEQDLKLIALDADIICRALQELAIDVAKDASKDIGINIFSFVNCSTDALSDIIKKTKIDNNMDKILELKFNSNVVNDYTMTIPNVTLMKDAQVTTEVKQEVEAVVEDAISSIQFAINDGMMAGINNRETGLLGLLNSADGDAYNAYKVYVEIAKNKANHLKGISDNYELLKATKVNEIRNSNMNANEQGTEIEILLAKLEAEKNSQLVRTLNIADTVKECIIANDTISALYSAKHEGETYSGAYITEVASKLRSALYTQAVKRGIDVKEVVRCAIAATFCYINGKGNVVENKYAPKLYAVKKIFPREFALEYITEGTSVDPSQALTNVLTLTQCGIDLYAGDVLSFNDGIAFFEGAMVMVKENFTDNATVTAEGYIVAEVDYYAFDEVGYIILDSVCVENTQEASNLITPETQVGKGYNSVMTKAVDNCTGCVVNNGHMLIQNTNGSITVVGKVAAHHVAKGKASYGAISNKYGFICYTK